MIIGVLLLVLLVSLVSVALQNTIYVPLKFMFWTIDASLAVYVIGAFTIGILAGLLLAIPNLVKKSLKLSNQQKTLKGIKKELEEVRGKPSSDSSNEEKE